MAIKKITTSLTLVFLLAACGGGGGGGGGGLAPGVASSPINFTRFNGNDFTAASRGIYANVNYTNDKTTSAGQVQFHTSGKVSADYTALPKLRSVSINNPALKETFFVSEDDVEYLSGPEAYVLIDDPSGVQRNEYILLFDYFNRFDEQFGSFGFWEDDNGSSGTIGVEVFGDFSDASQIPISGTAQYRGYHGGFYTDGANEFVTTGSFRTDVDFATRTISSYFATTAGYDIETGVYQNLGLLDFAFIDAIVSEQNDLSAGFTKNLDYTNFRADFQFGINNDLSGQITHFFMGPNAEEMSGYFYFRNASSNNFELYSGGFTGKQ